jgi:hypothetical protein
LEDVGHGGMDLAVVEEGADMTEVEDMTGIQAIEIPAAEVMEVPEEDIRQNRRCIDAIDLSGIIPSKLSKIHILFSETPVSESETGCSNYPAQRGFESNLV